MRATLIAIVLGLGFGVLAAAPSFACPFHDQQASATDQQQAQLQHSSGTATQ